ncbi:Uncharacterised protein [Mycoplasmopsis maculosa]|uniref:Uncharacterized protein n=1 Tax=Mycoplasmopsis maculosa TaxID=114885 RepID=A0A449B3H1_9BACT|nr:Uncharacterised protein [Mycoplasmopsis maculosa]
MFLYKSVIRDVNNKKSRKIKTTFIIKCIKGIKYRIYLTNSIIAIGALSPERDTNL